LQYIGFDRRLDFMGKPVRNPITGRAVIGGGWRWDLTEELLALPPLREIKIFLVDNPDPEFQKFPWRLREILMEIGLRNISGWH